MYINSCIIFEAKLKNLRVGIYVHFFYQVCNCQWALDVALLHNKYCSCEKAKTGNTYRKEADNCRKCDTLFEVTVSPCQETDSSWPFSVCSDVMKYSQNLADDEDGLLFISQPLSNPWRYNLSITDAEACTCILIHYNLMFSSLKLTISIKEVDGGTGQQNNLTDDFIVMLSLSGANNAIYFTGNEKIDTIKLIYWIYVSYTYLEHCPTLQPSVQCQWNAHMYT